MTILLAEVFKSLSNPNSESNSFLMAHVPPTFLTAFSLVTATWRCNKQRLLNQLKCVHFGFERQLSPHLRSLVFCKVWITLSENWQPLATESSKTWSGFHLKPPSSNQRYKSCLEMHLLEIETEIMLFVYDRNHRPDHRPIHLRPRLEK